MKSILFTVSILVATHAAHSQSRLDSLQALYDSANNDSARISIGLSMLDDMANQQPLMAIELSEQLLKEIPQSDVLSEDHRNDWTMRVLHALSNAYRYVGDNERVVKVLLQELDMAGAIGDASRERGVLMNIGVAYQNVGMKDEALNYYRRSLKISLDENHVYGIAMAYGNIGTLQGNTADQDSQLFYYKLSLGAMKQEGMYHREAAMGWMMNNIGKCHELAGIPDSALYYYQESLRLRQSIDHRLGMFIIHRELALYFRNSGDRDRALEHINESISIGEKSHFVSYLNLSYELRSQLLASTGDYSGALSDYKQFVAYSDSSSSENDARDLIRQTMTYEYEKAQLADSLEYVKKEAIQNLQIEKQQVNLEKQRLGLIASGGGLVLLLLLAYTVRKGKRRSDELLHNILPEEVAAELKDKGHADAKLFDEITVLFTDFIGFTSLSEQLSASDLVSEIDTCFKVFDGIMEKYRIEKIKTIGDAYMAAGGLHAPRTSQPKDVIKAALEMQAYMKSRKTQRENEGLPAFEMRVGIHTGSVVAGIVGIKKFQYDIWGDTVNTASRMESNGEVGEVNISQSTYELVRNSEEFEFTPRGRVTVKGKGELEMYFVKGTA